MNKQNFSLAENIQSFPQWMYADVRSVKQKGRGSVACLHWCSVKLKQQKADGP